MLNEIWLAIRELHARFAIELFFFFAPKKMQQIYAKYILIASYEYIDELKREAGWK